MPATTKVYQYSKCSTCRKALKWLDEHSVPYEAIDIVQAPPSRTLLTQVLRKSGLDVKRLFNTSGQSYRNGGFKQRLATMTEEEALDALAADGKLVKRPLVVARDFALVGFKEDEYSTRLE